MQNCYLRVPHLSALLHQEFSNSLILFPIFFFAQFRITRVIFERGWSFTHILCPHPLMIRANILFMMRLHADIEVRNVALRLLLLL